MAFKIKAGSKTFLVLTACFISGLILLSGHLYFQYERSRIRKERYEEIRAIANVKISQLSNWHEDRLRDARAIYRNPFFERDIEQLLRDRSNKELRRNILGQLSYTRVQGGYENIFLMDTAGEIVFAMDSALTHLDSSTRAYIAEAEGKKTIVNTDLYWCSHHKMIHYDQVVPVINREERCLAFLVFRVDPRVFLYPRMQHWPTPSKSSETLIVRRDGDSVIFLNDIRFLDNTALSLRISMSRTEVPAIKVVSGHEGIFEGVDYRGIPVLSYVCAVPGTNWFMVAKIDRSEIFAELYYRAFITVVIVFILLLLTGIALSRFHYARQRDIYRELYRQERMYSEMEQEYRTILLSIGDGVISTGTDGRIRHMNRVAEYLTGWRETDAKDRDLREVFRAYKENTHDEADLPVDQVMKDGTVAGLPEGSVLVDARGHQIPIAGNCSAINIEDGIVLGATLIFRDQTAAREAVSKLEESEERFRKSILEAPVPMLIHDEEGRCYEISKGWTQYSGYTLKDIPTIGDWTALAYGERSDFADDYINRLFEINETISNGIWNVTTRDGLVRHWDFYTTPIGRSGDNKRLLLSLAVDITERVIQDEKLRLINHELERSNKELEQFAYIASHDLQEPLRMISSFTQLLHKRYKVQLGSDADDFIGYIVDGANRMQRLIQDLLSYSRINTRGEKFKPVDFHDALGEAIANLQALITEKGAIVTNDDLPVVPGDHGQVVQLFQNLIANGIKFHGEASPLVHVSAVAGDGEWIFSVKDNGIGIESQYFDKIFVIFQRLHAGTVYSGTGIGLAICTRIVKRHQGRIWVESEPGKGSVFYFSVKNSEQ